MAIFRLSSVAVTFAIASFGVVSIPMTSAAVGALAADGNSEATKVERWKLVAEISGMRVDMLVVFRIGEDGEAQGATLSIPLQGLKDAGLRDVTYTKDAIRFALQPAGAPVAAQFDLKREGDNATGTFKQPGQEIAITMERLPEGASADVGPRRPQTPKPPFPYSSQEVVVHGWDGAAIAGALVTPPGDGPFPAVLLLNGSGAQDRDETIFGHHPFLVIADALARAGVASLRLDDRGVGKSAGDLSKQTIDNEVDDSLQALEFLRHAPGIDGSHVGILGHSEGGMIGPMTAAKAPDAVAFLVLLAGPGVAPIELMPLQLRKILEASGVPAPVVQDRLALQRAFLNAIAGDADEHTVYSALRAQFVGPGSGGEPKTDEAKKALQIQVDAQMRAWNTPWFHSFLKVQPSEYLSKVRCPTLALNGSLDLQVPPDENLQALMLGFERDDAARLTTRVLPGLNHLFQPATRGTPDEYAQIETTIDPSALSAIVRWVTRVTGVRAGAHHAR